MNFVELVLNGGSSISLVSPSAAASGAADASASASNRASKVLPEGSVIPAVGGMVKGLHSYTHAGGKFFFHKGDLMEIVDVVDQNWIKARRFDGGKCIEGLAPLNYVFVMPQEDQEA